MSNQGRVSVKIDHTMTEDENGARGVFARSLGVGRVGGGCSFAPTGLK